MKPIYKILFTLITAFIFINIIGAICLKGHRKFYKPFYDKLDEIFYGSTSYDIIFLGNSKIQFGLNPKIVDSIANKNTYNIAYAAAGFATENLLLSNYLKNHKAPKKIVWCVDDVMFNTNADASNFYLFYNYLKFQSVENYFKENNKPFDIAKLFPAMQFIYFDDYNKGNIATGLFNKSNFTSTDRLNYKGFSISTNKTDEIKFNTFVNNETDTFNNIALHHFFNMIKLCKQNNIEIQFITPPHSTTITAKDISEKCPKIYALLDSVCKQNNYNLLRYDITNEFLPSEFIDNGHLNYTGSNHLSTNIGVLLNK